MLAAYPDRSRIQETIKHIRLLIGKLNHKENIKEQEEENKVTTDLQPGDLVLARVLPRGASKLGNKYRRNIYKITQRVGRKLKITAQFGNLEVVTIHVKNVKNSSSDTTWHICQKQFGSFSYSLTTTKTPLKHIV